MHRRHTTGSIEGHDSIEEIVPTTSSGKKKRFRKAYSCGNCRYQKIKCERTFPCHQCELRSIAASCGANTIHHEYLEADERRKLGIQIGQGGFSSAAASSSRSQTQSQTTLVESPLDTISSSDSKSPAQATLETLYRTVDSFHTHIALVEQQVLSLQLPSSSTGPPRGIRQRHPTSSGLHSESRTVEQNLDPIIEQLKQLERKVDLIYQRLAMACPSTSNMLAPPYAPGLPPAIPPKPPEPASTSTNADQNRLDATALPMEDLQFDSAITQWLQQETLTTAALGDQFSMADMPSFPYMQDVQPFLPLNPAPNDPTEDQPPPP